MAVAVLYVDYDRLAVREEGLVLLGAFAEGVLTVGMAEHMLADGTEAGDGIVEHRGSGSIPVEIDFEVELAGGIPVDIDFEADLAGGNPVDIDFDVQLTCYLMQTLSPVPNQSTLPSRAYFLLSASVVHAMNCPPSLQAEHLRLSALMKNCRTLGLAPLSALQQLFHGSLESPPWR